MGYWDLWSVVCGLVFICMECNIEENKRKCNCTYEPCSRKGKCCECIDYHWGIGELPACFFPNEIERTYDRSIRRFIEVHKHRT